MVDDTPEDAGSTPDPGRVKRAPPTIDLEATEVSSEPAKAEVEAAAEPAPEEPPEEPAPVDSPPVAPAASRPVSPWVIAPFSGAVAAALVIAVGWMLGWPPVEPATPAASQVDASALNDLTARVASLEAKASKPATPSADPATAARIETLGKSLAALQSRSDQLAAAVNDAKAAPHEGATAAAVDLSAINERIARIEKASRAQGAEKADDLPLRRLVAAALLDVAVQHGDPFAAQLTTAKSLAANPDQLKPLDPFAATGVPSPMALDRELLTLVPKLSPPRPESSTVGTGIVDRLQAGAARLVRIERTDVAGTDRGAVVARVTAAAMRNDFAEARRELSGLAPADRGAAQAWLDKAAARDDAIATSRQFADDAMAMLAKPAQ